MVTGEWGLGLEITRRTDYALRILLEMARLPNGVRVSAQDLSKLADVSYPFARGIITRLAAVGLLTSRRGAGGGISLARSASSITLLEIVRVMEGDVSLNLCARDPHYCARSGSCPAHAIWEQATDRLESLLASKDLAALAAERPQETPVAAWRPPFVTPLANPALD